MILQILYNRQIVSQSKIDEFFNPDYEQDLFDPFLLSDMNKAVSRLLEAKEKKERAAVFGDYDADGVTSSVILTDFLKNVVGISGQVYIPDRVLEGYGLNKKALDWLLTKNIRLVITCDCGVSNKEEIDYGKNKGLDFIVLDHHHLHEKFSEDDIIVNPKKAGDRYPFKELAACGVVFKFVQAVLRSKKDFLKNAKSCEKWLLDLVAIGTVADCVPLISENRTLVKYGMKVLVQSKRAGLLKLMKKAGVDLKKIDTYDLSFVIAPRINAAGRVDHANKAYKLLSSSDEVEAEKLAEDIEDSNYRRQTLTNRIVREVKEQALRMPKSQRIIWAANEDWPLGVVGVVAGKILEEFSRPAFVLSKGKNESTGSARSTTKFNLIENISKFENLLLEYGGHKQAAGIALKNENLEEFFDKMEHKAKAMIKEEDLTPSIKIDAQIELNEISFQLYERLHALEPYGIGNEKPVFQSEGAKIKEMRVVGQESQHLKMVIASDSLNFDVIGFNQASSIFQKIKVNDTIDLVYEIDCQEWNGQKKLELKMLDFKKVPINYL